MPMTYMPPLSPVPCEQCGSFYDVRPKNVWVKPKPSIWDRVQSKEGGLTPTAEIPPDDEGRVMLCGACVKRCYEAGLL